MQNLKNEQNSSRSATRQALWSAAIAGTLLFGGSVLYHAWSTRALWGGVASSKPEPGRVSGMVRLAGAEAQLSAARVLLHPLRSADPREVSALDESPGANCITAHVDNAGRFSAELPTQGRYSVSVSAPGLPPTWTELEVGAESSVDVTLRPGGFALDIALKDLQGQSLSGVSGSITTHAGQVVAQFSELEGDHLQTRLPAGEYTFHWAKAGFASRVEQRLVLADEKTDILLAAPHPLKLLVQREPAAVPGAEVVVISFDGSVAARGTSDENGQFTVPHLPAGEYLAWAGNRTGRAELEFSVGSAEHSEPLLLKLNAETSPTLDLPLPQECEPEVASLAPAAAARRLRTIPLFATEQNASGESRLKLWLSPNPQSVSVHCAEQVANIVVEPKGSSEISWAKTGRRAGIVRDAAGLPLQGVVVEQWGADRVQASATAVTDVEGKFALTGAALGAVELRARHPRYGLLRQVVPAVTSANAEPQVEPVELRFAPDHYVSGHLRDESGKPVAGATVAFSSANGGSTSAQSIADGAFKVGPVGRDHGFLVVFGGGEVRHDKPVLVAPSNDDVVVVVSQM